MHSCGDRGDGLARPPAKQPPRADERLEEVKVEARGGEVELEAVPVRGLEIACRGIGGARTKKGRTTVAPSLPRWYYFNRKDAHHSIGNGIPRKWGGAGSISMEHHYICPIFSISLAPSARRRRTENQQIEAFFASF